MGGYLVADAFLEACEDEPVVHVELKSIGSILRSE